MRKNRRQKVEEGADEWITSYADIMSLLLTFFILLFSFSTIDAEKWKALVASMRGEPNVLETPQYMENSMINLFDENSLAQMMAEQERDGEDEAGEDEQEESVVPTETPMAAQEAGGASATPTATPEPTQEPGAGDDSQDYYEFGVDNDIFLKLYNEILAYKEKADLGGGLGVYKTETEIILRFQNNLMFDSGKDNINSASLEIITAIIPMLEKYEVDIKNIRIEGHTDNVPIHNANFQDNYELSTSRSLTVLRYIKDNSDFPPEKLVAIGYGEFNPISSNDTEEGRAENRRTDIVLVAISG